MDLSLDKITLAADKLGASKPKKRRHKKASHRKSPKRVRAAKKAARTRRKYVINVWSQKRRGKTVGPVTFKQHRFSDHMKAVAAMARLKKVKSNFIVKFDN